MACVICASRWERERERERERGGGGERERERETQRERQTDRERQRDKERDRERQRGRERDPPMYLFVAKHGVNEHVAGEEVVHVLEELLPDPLLLTDLPQGVLGKVV